MRMINEEFSPKHFLNNQKTKLEQYVFIFHNVRDGPKKVSLGEFEHFKKQLEVNFLFNYSDIKGSHFFQELTPNLKKKLLAHLIEQEVKFFSYLFYDIPRNSRFGQKQLMVSWDTIF